MKKALYLAAFLVLITITCFAAGEGKATKEKIIVKPDTVFQKLGDLITGEHVVDGKPLKEVGIFQATADEIKKAEPLPVQ